ncbi:MAG: hypothetical protein BECKG1743D_GA0114223_107661, partial [Candidatus Kentron sp. G]
YLRSECVKELLSQAQDSSLTHSTLQLRAAMSAIRHPCLIMGQCPSNFEGRNNYPNRLKPFSDAFYHKVTASQDYPLAPEEQGRAYFFEDTGIQFIALNTAWEIDQFHPRRSGVHPEALANALAAADRQVREAIEDRRVEEGGARLRIAVFHHAIGGPWAMQDLAFLENLQTAGVRLCLHGDVHEMRRQWIDYWDEERGLRVLGAGTFGARRDAITEGSARSYNLIEITPDLTSARVYVREQPKPDGAWRGWNRFPDPDGGRGEVPFFHVELDPRRTRRNTKKY